MILGLLKKNVDNKWKQEEKEKQREDINKKLQVAWKPSEDVKLVEEENKIIKVKSSKEQICG